MSAVIDNDTKRKVDALCDALDKAAETALHEGLPAQGVITALVQWALNVAVDSGWSRNITAQIVDDTYRNRQRPV